MDIKYGSYTYVLKMKVMCVLSIEAICVLHMEAMHVY